MITITNTKIAGFDPVWAPFKGFSLLFDNPGDSLSIMNREKGLYQMDCRNTNPELSFYHALWSMAKRLDQLKNTYLFCPLPHYSYHVTVWDGLNDFNVNRVSRQYRFEGEALLQKDSGAFLDDSPFYRQENGELYQIVLDGPITFAYDQLVASTNTVVVRLKPADSISEQRMEELVKQRNTLQADFKQQFGFTPASDDYRPHVTLGYFANQELSLMAEYAFHQLKEKVERALQGKKLTFETIGLYGMSDMKTFYKKVKP